MQSTSQQLLKASTSVTHQQKSVFQTRKPSGRKLLSKQSRCQDAGSGRAGRVVTSEVQPHHADRRLVLQMLGLPALLAAAAPLSAVAAEGAAASSQLLVQYKDAPDEFELDVPAGWIAGEGQAEGAKFGGASGVRRALAWYPESATGTSTNVSLIITSVGADYTKLGSFGTPLGFGENLVASMDRKFMKKAGTSVQEARLLSTAETKSNGHQLYLVDYAVKKPGEDEERLLISAVCLGFNGRYNRLYTLTAQTLASDFKQNEKMLRSVIKSFKPPAPVV